MVKLTCIVPLNTLLQQQGSWVFFHEVFIVVGLLVCAIGFVTMLLERIGVIDWDTFATTAGVGFMIIGVAVIINNSYWRSTAASNPLYYAYAECPQRFASPEAAVPTLVPLPGELR